MTSPGQSGERLWLNVASSTYVEPDFVNLDNHVYLRVAQWPAAISRLFPARHQPLIQRYREAQSRAAMRRHDCRRDLPYRPASVDHILCSHFLEHVFPDEALTILQDFRRALKPGASLHVIVPDLRTIVERYVAAKDGGSRDAADQLVLNSLLSTGTRGSRKFRLMEALGGFGLTHRWMYDAESIGDLVAAAGFEIDNGLATPSDHVRKDDGESVHVRARRPQ